MTEPVIIGDATLYCGDCMEILPTLEPADLVLTDPPFGVGNFVQATGKIHGRGANRGKPVTWNDASPDADFFALLREKSRHRIIWGANFFNCFEEKGGAIVWDKLQPMPDKSAVEIASCTHFKKTGLFRKQWTNFIVRHEAATDHPCERPVQLYEFCLTYIPNCTGTVLDPFFGSGSTGVACANLGRKFIGIEIEPKYFDIACERIDAAYAQGRLFT